MKILIVLPKFILAGVETMCENLANGLTARGHQVIIASLYTYHSAITERLEAKGIKIYYLDKKPGFDSSIRQKLWRIYMEEKPDVLHTHLYVTKYAIPAAKGLGMRRVHTMHNIAREENKTFGGVTLNRIFFKLCDVTPVALSEVVKWTICKYYHRKPETVPVVGNGIPLENCIPKTEEEILAAGGGNGEDDISSTYRFHILNVGRYTPQKNQAELIRAMKIVHETHPEAALTLLGDGECREALENQIAELDARSYIQLLPSTDNVYPVLHNADVFTLPSIYEGMPMTIIEAMGTGLPVQASRVGGVPDMITDDISGLLCEPDAKSIASGLIRLIENPELRASLSRNALRESKNFSAEIMAEKYEEIYLQKPCGFKG